MGAGGTNDILLDEPIRPNQIVMNNGSYCPIMGMGTDCITKDEHIDIVYQSIKDGIRLIDTEPKNEIIVGKAIKRAIDDGIVRREDLFIITKLELDEKEDPEKAIRESLGRLQVNKIDLYLDHWPSCRNYKNQKKLIPVKDTWLKMEELVRKNLTKGIGVSNYNAENLLNILSILPNRNSIKPCAIEVEFHPYLYQKDLKELCDKENIVLFAYNPLCKGQYCDRIFLQERNYDLFTEAPIMYLSEKYFENQKYKNTDRYHITKGQIILNWHMRLGVVPIPGTLNKDRMKENLVATKFSISDSIIKLLCSYNQRQHRFKDGSDIFGYDIFG
jgi:diketogulonate reductase-like aldo/keto reductase